MSNREAREKDPDNKELKKGEAYFDEEFHKEIAKVFPSTSTVDEYIQKRWPTTTEQQSKREASLLKEQNEREKEEKEK